MKKLSLILILLCAVMLPTFAQERKMSRQEMRKELQEYKLKYLIQEMELRDETAQKKFCDIYNQMEDERVKVFKETRALKKRLNSGNASDEEYESVSRSLTDAKEKVANIEKRYDEKFATFLTSKQIFKMKTAEETFRQKMRELRHKKK